MGTLMLSFHSCTLVIFIILLSLCTSNGEDHKHDICSTSLMSCGTLTNIGYPFWGLGRPQYCGHPALHLECPSYAGIDYPVLTIRDHKEVNYTIIGINNTSPKITIQLRGFTESGCLYHKSNKVFDKVFRFSEGVENITLYNECYGEEIKDVPFQFKTCWGNNGSAYYLNKTSSTKKFQGCNRVEVPVLKGQKNLLQRDETITVSGVLQLGFKVDYLNSSASFKCINSSGTCGSNDTEFACFHPAIITEFNTTAGVSHAGHRKLIARSVIPGAFAIVIAVIALTVGFWGCLKHKFNSPASHSSKLPLVPINSDLETGSSFYGIPVFPYNELQEATNDFNEFQKLGDGGFGVVYYGKLKDGREVAVKRLYEKNYKQIAQFINEIEILTCLRHPNLVTLYGCTSRSSRELLLVYEFIPCGTVADHLYGKRKGSETLSWDIRMKIAIGTARALSYLHASDIIHRDVKTNNILLDNHFSVKVADLGLSRLFPNDTKATHVTTSPQGTPGYLDPSYNKCYKVTSKSDVYSFGVVLVELISSLPAVDTSRQEGEINLSDYAMKRIQHGTLIELVDQKLGFETDFKVKEMITLVAELAFRCLQQERELRPSMDEVLEVLKQIGSSDYEASKAEDKDRSTAEPTPTSLTEKDGTNPPLRNSQDPTSPNSVIASWVSKSSASSTNR